MSNIFNSVRLTKPKGSSFNLSYENKFTAKFGDLIPFFHQEVLPGDKIKVGQQHLMRLAPTLAPLMQQVDVYMHYFFVPNRLIWDDWEDFISNNHDKVAGVSKIAPTMPKIEIDLTDVSDASTDAKLALLKSGSLADYFNFPSIEEFDVNSVGKVQVNALPFRAYTLIYNEYYRDQNLIDEVNISKSSGVLSGRDNVIQQNLMLIRKRAWLHDYFTSALPWPQYGASPVRIPFELNQGEIYYKPFVSTGNGQTPFDDYSGTVLRNRDGSTLDNVQLDGDIEQAGHGSLRTNADGRLAYQQGSNTSNLGVDNTKNLGFRFSSAAVPSVTDMRRAYRVQEWLERQAVGGSRYIEQILSHFGVRSSDARLQRPEYLCGIKTPLIMSEVQQTSASVDDSNAVQPLGQLGGNGTSVGQNFAFSRHFEEHGQLIGILSVMPKTSYFQGLPRKYSRESWEDFYWPEFANIGEQAIKNKEIYYDYEQGVSNRNESEFGYAPRYAEYRYNPNEVHGEFRNSLRFWHLGRKFGSCPDLNRSFIEYDNKNIDNALAVSSDVAHPLYCQFFNNVSAYRLIPKYADAYL